MSQAFENEGFLYVQVNMATAHGLVLTRAGRDGCIQDSRRLGFNQGGFNTQCCTHATTHARTQTAERSGLIKGRGRPGRRWDEDMTALLRGREGRRERGWIKGELGCASLATNGRAGSFGRDVGGMA